MIPLLVVISLLILFFTKDSIFFNQIRIGKGGKKFNLYKFRTMSTDNVALSNYFKDHPDEEKIWRNKQKLIFDPRITKIGYFLREYSLDELPQIYNILKGDMSFIGPRPIIEEEILKYSDSYSIYKKVKPGISGLWQVSGRNDTTYKERIDFDVFYVKNQSFFLDIKIFIKTFKAVLSKKGAY